MDVKLRATGSTNIAVTKRGVRYQTGGAPANNAPVANNFSVTVTESTTRSINFLLYSSDLDGDVLTVTVASNQSQNGVTLTDNGDGTFDYPAPAGSGSDRIFYEVSDGTDTASAFCDVTIQAVGAAAIQIVAQRTTGTAPAGFFFTAIPTGFSVDDQYADVYLKWEFGDPSTESLLDRIPSDEGPHDRVYDVDGQTRIVRGPMVYDTADNFVEFATISSQLFQPTSGTTKTFLGYGANRAYGNHVCRVFPVAGSYSVSVTGTDPNGTSVTETVAITVDDPETKYIGDKTYVVHPTADTADVNDSGWDGAPDGALRYNSLVDAWDHASNRVSVRILAARGQEFSTDGVRTGNRAASLVSHQWGAYGTGDPPRFYGNLSAECNAGAEGTIWGIDFIERYDPADPYSIVEPISVKGIEHRGPDGYKTYWDLYISGYRNCINDQGGTRDVVYSNIWVDGWNNFGYFANQKPGRIGFHGVALFQRDCINKTGKYETYNPFYPDHGPWRCDAFAGPTAFSMLLTRSRNTWASPDTSVQGGIRFNGIGSKYPDGDLVEAYFDRCTTEGAAFGSGTYGRDEFGDPREIVPVRIVYDKCLVTIFRGNGVVSGANSSGINFRNCVYMIADAPDATNGAFIRPNSVSQLSQEAAGGRVAFYGNTLYDARSGSNRKSGMVGIATSEYQNAYAEVIEVNNIVVAPNYVDGFGDTEIANMAGGVFLPRDHSFYQEDVGKAETQADADLCYYLEPEGGNSAYQAATGQWTGWETFFGNDRGSSPNKGAL